MALPLNDSPKALWPFEGWASFPLPSPCPCVSSPSSFFAQWHSSMLTVCTVKHSGIYCQLEFPWWGVIILCLSHPLRWQNPLPLLMRGPLWAALYVPVFCGRLISLPAPPHGCPNKVSQQAPTSKRAVHGSCRKVKRQDAAFSYLFGFFANRGKELKPCELFCLCSFLV